MTQIWVTTGPESTGKTTLATQLSDLLRAPLVTEVAREYLGAKYRADPGFSYQQHDLLTIAREQHQQEAALLAHAPQAIVCDTDLLVLMIWSDVRYGACDPWISTTFETSLATTNRTYLLCDHHIPWQSDPLREHPDERANLFGRYLQKLQDYGATYLISEGSPNARLAQFSKHLRTH